MIQQQAQPSMKRQGWIFPGNPACTAMQEITHFQFDVLKPEYFHLNDDGSLSQLDDSECNGYSPANAALIKQYSQQQFTTISGSIAGIQALATDSLKLVTFEKTITAFLKETGFTGIEIDVEDFGSWTSKQYSMYKNVINLLGHDLHAIGCQLLIDTPAIANADMQDYYPVWRYEDFNNLAVDSLVVMAYDAMYDSGASTPVAPLAWIRGVCQWMLAKVADHNRIVIGLNSYGYTGTTNASNDIEKVTYQQAMRLPGFTTAKRDASSGEFIWQVGNKSYDYSDSETINQKIAIVQSLGISAISIWHIGGNQYPTMPTNASVQPATPLPATPPMPTPPATETPQDALLNAFSQVVNDVYPGFDEWYKANFSEGKYIG